MESEGEQKAEIIPMAQASVGLVDSTNVKQDARQEVPSWVRRARRRCKELLRSKSHWLCLCCGVLLVIVCIAITASGKSRMCHSGKFTSEQCPSEWIGYRNTCYFISEEERNWTSSQTFCTENGSLLAVFESLEEMHSLAKYLRIDDSWIGLRKKGESFYWENGIALKKDLFRIQNHSECAYWDAFTISTSACSLPRRWICTQSLKGWMT